MFLRALFLVICLPLAGLAQGLPDPLSDTVSDYADLLPPEAEARVDAALRKGREETGVHVVVVTMERIADYGGADQRIDDFAKGLFNAWGIGDKDRNDGILILVSRADREVRIALGAGYEVIWDNAAQRVIDRYFLPAFRDDRYSDGIEAGVPATFDLIARPYVAGNPPPEKPFDLASLIPLLMGGLVALGVIGAAFNRQIGNLVYRAKACPNCGSRGMRRTMNILTPATTKTEGTGERRILCPSCGTERTEQYVVPRLGRSSSSSGGGFGGGSSSGGGASGRW